VECGAGACSNGFCAAARRRVRAAKRWAGARLDVRHPAVVVGLKGHPALEDLARARHVAQHLLHVDVLVPGGAPARASGAPPGPLTEPAHPPPWHLVTPCARSVVPCSYEHQSVVPRSYTSTPGISACIVRSHPSLRDRPPVSGAGAPYERRRTHATCVGGFCTRRFGGRRRAPMRAPLMPGPPGARARAGPRAAAATRRGPTRCARG